MLTLNRLFKYSIKNKLNFMVNKIFWRMQKHHLKQFTAKVYLLNTHSGDVKIDAYLLQFLCNMTSDVKFFFIYIAVEKLYLNINQILIFLEAAVHRCSLKQVFFKIDVLKIRLEYRCFPVKFARLLGTPFFTEHLRWLLLSFLKQRKNEKI